ncbi:MAG: hypothetical protein J6S51_01310 [Kiritimatiellae bacterium]|nr:hypothetical protein [Kiritimatiellia bacterium]
MIDNKKHTEKNYIQEQIIKKVLLKLTKTLQGKTKNIAKPCEDIAIEAVSYAIKNKKIAWSNLKTAENHFFYSALIASKWLINTEAKKQKKSLVEYSFNNDIEEEYKDGCCKPSIESKYSFQKYFSDEKDDEFLTVGRKALNKLDKFLTSKGVSQRDIEIYKERELYNIPSNIVKKNHNVSINNLYKIVCVIKRILTEHGQDLIRAA